MKVEAGNSTYLVPNAPGEDPAFQLMGLLAEEPDEFWVGIFDEEVQRLADILKGKRYLLPPWNRRDIDSKVIFMDPITPKPFDILVKP